MLQIVYVFSIKKQIDNIQPAPTSDIVIPSSLITPEPITEREIVTPVAKAPIKVVPEVIGVKWYSKAIKELKDCGEEECDPVRYEAGTVTKGTFKDFIVYMEISDNGMESYTKLYIIFIKC